MEPLTPNDPLWNLLGKARPVEPRPNFTQNVLRAARQTPQDRGWLAGLGVWWSESFSTSWGMRAALASIVLALTGLGVMWFEGHSPAPDSRVVTSEEMELDVLVLDDDAWLVELFGPALPDDADRAQQEWEAERLAALLSVQDTYTLTDRELALLLY